jgi:hypothetical protein
MLQMNPLIVPLLLKFMIIAFGHSIAWIWKNVFLYIIFFLDYCWKQFSHFEAGIDL